MTPGPPADEVVHCAELAAEIERWERSGARLEAVWPADDPRHAIVRYDGRLIELRAERPPVAVDTGERRVLVSAPGEVVAGRAGMQYRDLIPGRLGGRYVASSIRIPDGGPVPDYVHHHDVRFQLIFCAAGWVRVVYEDQGPPFVLHPGDCVLQPPGIRHRVLEASPGLEVIEISSPAEHVTFREHALALPTAAHRPDRLFGGQRFVHHVASATRRSSWRRSTLECRDLGLAEATNGLARGCVVVGAAPGDMRAVVADADLTFLYVLCGEVDIEIDIEVDGEVDRGPGRTVARLASGTAVVVPPGATFRLASWTVDLSLLDVAVGPEA